MIQTDTHYQHSRAEVPFLSGRLICLTVADKIIGPLLQERRKLSRGEFGAPLSRQRLFSLMLTLIAVQAVFCSSFFKIIFLKRLNPLRSRHASPSGTVSSQRVPHMGQACYSGPEMCKPGSSKTYTIPLPRTGLSQGVFCTKAAPTHFLDLGNLFPRTRRVMTDDKRQVQPINRE